MTVLATLKDGRVIAEGTFTTTWILSGTTGYISATVAELRKVEKALGVNLTTSLYAQTVSPHSGPYYDGNVVGLSVYVGSGAGRPTGTSVGGGVQVIGY